MKMRTLAILGCLAIYLSVPVFSEQAKAATQALETTVQANEMNEEQNAPAKAETQASKGREGGLYAPPSGGGGGGGQPIGGETPISDGIWVLLALSSGYLFYRFLMRRSNMKKIFTLLFVLSAAFSMNAQDRGQLKSKTQQDPQLRSAIRNATASPGSIEIDRNAAYHNFTPSELVKVLFLKNYNSCASADLIQNVNFIGAAGTDNNLAWQGNAWQTDDRPLMYFSKGTSSFPLQSGLLLSTGGASFAEGPMTKLKVTGQDMAGSKLNGGYSGVRDPDLLKLLIAINPLADQGANKDRNPATSTILEFDFIALKPTITFNYIFASEEYSYYNFTSGSSIPIDVFGFFVSGPGINGGKGYTNNARNIATVPGTGEPVSTLTITKGYESTDNITFPKGTPRNPQYLVPLMNNSPLMEYGGHTVPLKAVASGLEVGKQYHIKLAIGNGGDSNLGSAVFLEGGSFDLGLGTTNYGAGIEGMDNVFGGSEDNSFYVGLYNQSAPLNIKMTYTLNGQPLGNEVTLLNGDPLPPYIALAAGSTAFAMNNYKVADNVTGVLNIHAYAQECGYEWDKTINIYPKFSNPKPVITTPCSGVDGQATLNFTVTGGSPSMQMSKDNGVTWQRITQPYTNLSNGTYNIILRDSVGSYQQTIPVTILAKHFESGGPTVHPSVLVPNGDPGIVSVPIPTGGSSHYQYVWSVGHGSSNGMIWTQVPNNNSNEYSPGPLASTTWFMCSITDPTCGNFSDYGPFVTTVTTDLYWGIRTRNSIWSDGRNWFLEDGSEVYGCPIAGINAHIPGDAANYPVLNSSEAPVCKNLILHFGGQLGQQHYLTYEKAFVQYNFGYYDAIGDFLDAAGSFHSSPAMERDRWYALAAPIKRMYSGDFSFGGYPYSWQQGFMSTPGHSGSMDVTGMWYVPEKKIAFDLGGNQNNAICLFMPSFSDGVLGEGDHRGLNAINGIVEIPYYENNNANVLSAHRLHAYQGSDLSRFYYFYTDKPNFPLNTAHYEDVSRANGSRFVIEDESTHTSPDTYTITVKAGVDVMIGNPFIGSLDFEQFYAANSSVMSNFYRLYVNTSWDTYTVGSGGAMNQYISPLQAFFIKTIGSGTVQLNFPRASSVAPGPADINSLRSSGSNKNNAFYLSASNAKGDSSNVTLSLLPSQENIYRLFSSDYPEAPQIYALSGKMKNDVQRVTFDSQESATIPLGILCSGNGELKIAFNNINDLTFGSVLLEDKVIGKTIDLLEDNTYTFTNIPANADNRFVLHLNKSKITTGIDALTNQQVAVTTNKNTVAVLSSNANLIKSVEVINLSGQTVFVQKNLNQIYTSFTLPENYQVYVVKVTSSNGITSHKIIIK